MTIVDVAPNVKLCEDADQAFYAKVVASDRQAAERELEGVDFRQFSRKLCSARWCFDWVELNRTGRLNTYVFVGL